MKSEIREIGIALFPKIRTYGKAWSTTDIFSRPKARRVLEEFEVTNASCMSRILCANIRLYFCAVTVGFGDV